MRRLIGVLIASFCLLYGGMPVFGSPEPIVLVTGVSGDVTAETTDASWTPLLGETLSVGTKLNLPAETDSLDLVHIKLQKEISLKGPVKDGIVIMNDGLGGISKTQWGNSMGGIPTDLAMGADALNQVGAIRDHSTSVQAPSQQIRGLVKPPSQSTIPTGTPPPAPESDNYDGVREIDEARAAGDKEALQVAMDRAKKNEEGTAKAVAGQKIKSLDGSSVEHQGIDEQNPGGRPSGEGASQASNENTPSEAVVISVMPAVESGPEAKKSFSIATNLSPKKKTNNIALGVPPQNFVLALPEELCTRLAGSDTHLSIQIARKYHDFALSQSPVDGWRLLTVTEKEVGKNTKVFLLRADKKATKQLKMQKPVSENVIAALKLEVDECFEVAASLWIRLFEAGLVHEKVAVAHLTRLKKKIMSPPKNQR